MIVVELPVKTYDADVTGRCRVNVTASPVAAKASARTTATPVRRSLRRRRLAAAKRTWTGRVLWGPRWRESRAHCTPFRDDFRYAGTIAVTGAAR